MVKVALYVVVAPLDFKRKAWVSSIYGNLSNLASTLSSQLDIEVYVGPLITSSDYKPQFDPSVDGVVAVVLSGGTDRMIYNVVSTIGKPSIIYAHPEENSLASVREAAVSQ
jgi:hypothetical protein